MGKIPKKIWKLFRNAIGILVLLVFFAVVGTVLYLRTEEGHLRATQQLLEQLSNQLGTRVEVGDLRYRFPNDVVLKNGVIYDQRGNPFIVFDQLEASLRQYDFSGSRIFLEDITLRNFVLKGYQYPDDSLYNFTYLLRNLTPDASDTTTRKRPTIYFKNINLVNGTFTIWDATTARDTTGADFNHVFLRDLNIKVEEMEVAGPWVSIDVNELRFRDTSGFVLNHLETDFSYEAGAIEFMNSRIVTPASDITTSFAFRYDSIAGMGNFNQDAAYDGVLKESVVTLRDIAYFAPKLPRSNEPVKVSATVKGPLTNLNISDADISFGQYSYLLGKVELNGLPALEETFINLRIRSAQSSHAELQDLLPGIAIPLELQRFGRIRTTGSFTGFYQDFVSYATFTTDIGTIKSDINLKLTRHQSTTTYNGSIALQNFDLGALTQRKELLGKTNLEASLEGQGMSINSIRANLQSTIRNIEVNNYNYQDITVNGNISKKLFTGNLELNDQNADLDFSGTIDFNEKRPRFDFTADVENVDLRALKLTSDTLRLSTTVTFNFVGDKIDSFEGNIIAQDLNIRTARDFFRFNELHIRSEVYTNYKEVEVNSDVFDLQLNGNYQFASLPALGQSVFFNYFDTVFFQLDEQDVEGQFVDFRLNVKNSGEMLKILNPRLTLLDTALVTGNINGSTGKVAFNANVAGIRFDEFVVRDISITGQSQRSVLTIEGGAEKAYRNDSLLITDFAFGVDANADTAIFKVNIADAMGDNRLNLNGFTAFDGDSARLHFQDSRMMVNRQTWDIRSQVIELSNDSVIYIPKLELSNNGQRIEVNGNITTDFRYPLDIQLYDIDLATVHDILPKGLENLEGTASGTATLYALDGEPVLISDIRINPLILGKDTVGIFHFASNFRSKSRNLEIRGNVITKRGLQVVDISGAVNFFEEENLAIKVKLQQTRVSLFQEFLKGLVSNMGGLLTADLDITGSFEDPVFKGNAMLDRASFTVDYLKTHYHFSHELQFDREKIILKDLRLLDKNNNVAVVNGELIFNEINNMEVDLAMFIDNFHVLNTGPGDNNLYYGTGYATGNVDFAGPVNNIRMNMNLRTERNTVFNLPITEEESFSGPSYIRFLEEERYFTEEYNVDVSGIVMDFRLDVTDDALMKIIIDPRVGDIIESRGNGNIRMELTPAGDFNIYGDYIIAEGEYLFTFVEIINKHFVLEQGGSIRWAGDPYGAMINMDAVYQLRANPGDLTGDLGNDPTNPLSACNQKVLVNVLLNLKGELFSPEIGMSLELPEVRTESGLSDCESFLRSSVMNDEEERNKQVFSLLALNRFVPVGQGISGTSALRTGVSSSVGEFLSNQLSYIASSFSNVVQVDFSYVTGDRSLNTNDEVIVNVTTNLLDDRLRVNTAYNTENIIENIEVSGKVTQEGNLRLKVFRKADENLILNKDITSYGIGVLFQKQFNTLKELFTRERKKDL
ncbi:MAG: translocation/assembly module TamB domain-containing protein [Bacteroidia bacterium]